MSSRCRDRQAVSQTERQSYEDTASQPARQIRSHTATQPDVHAHRDTDWQTACSLLFLPSSCNALKPRFRLFAVPSHDSDLPFAVLFLTISIPIQAPVAAVSRRSVCWGQHGSCGMSKLHCRKYRRAIARSATREKMPQSSRGCREAREGERRWGAETCGARKPREKKEGREEKETRRMVKRARERRGKERNGSNEKRLFSTGRNGEEGERIP